MQKKTLCFDFCNSKISKPTIRSLVPSIIRTILSYNNCQYQDHQPYFKARFRRILFKLKINLF